MTTENGAEVEPLLRHSWLFRSSFPAWTLERFENYQREVVGPEPLAEHPCEWPAGLAEAAPENQTVLDIPREAPLLGWRCWAVVDGQLVPPFLIRHDHPTLRERVLSATWQPGVNETFTSWCSFQPRPEHPSWIDTCGIRAVQSLTVLHAYVTQEAPRIVAPDRAFSQVAVWGHVAAHSPRALDWRWTLRAQYAQIVGPLYLTSRLRDSAAQLEDRYGVQVLPP